MHKAKNSSTFDLTLDLLSFNAIYVAGDGFISEDFLPMIYEEFKIFWQKFHRLKLQVNLKLN